MSEREPLDDAGQAWVESLASVGVVVIVRPERVVSWDHRKLSGIGLEDMGR
jgi:hypothetical protein